MTDGQTTVTNYSVTIMVCDQGTANDHILSVYLGPEGVDEDFRKQPLPKPEAE